MHLHQIARYIGIAFGAAAILLLIVGLSTYAFDATEGTLTKNEMRRIRPVGMYVGPRATQSRETVEDVKACYQYHVAEQPFESCSIGFGISHLTLAPLSREYWEKSQVGDKVRVYYLPSLPKVAVLHRGPDWIVSLVLGALAVFLVFVAKRIATLEQPSIDSRFARGTRQKPSGA